MPKRFLLTVLVAVTISAPCWASNDETALGVYSYSSSSLRLHLILDLDGARNVVINGRSYTGTFPVSQSGRHDGIATYSFSVGGKRISSNIQLTILFDDDDAVKGIAGFYSERSETFGAAGISNVHVFEPTFKRIELEMLPSQQKKK
jgi:hypothetical protein